MVERKKEGDFVARPVFSRQVSELYYSIRHPDTGEWVTNTYRVQGGGEAALRGLGVHLRVPGPGRAARPGPGAGVPAGAGSAEALAAASATSSTPWSPSTSPRGCGTRCWAPSNPSRWARAAAGWLVQGAHGTLCGVVQGITGAGIAECDGEARGLMGDILTGTPPNLTYEHPFIRKAWTAVWAVDLRALWW